MLNPEKFKERFSEGWWKKLKPFISSKECYEIYQQLKKSDKKIYPDSGDLWNAFRMFEYGELKAVVIGQSPYHTSKNGTPFADGLAFSCSKVNELSPSLSVLYNAIEDDIEKSVTRSPGLEYLSLQGVLLLNLSLTIDAGDKDSFEKHRNLWSVFIDYLFKEVLVYNTGIPFIVFGSPAKEDVSPYFTENHLVSYVKHPAYYARNNIKMEHKNCFSWAADICEKNNGEKLYWDSEEYFTNTLPF